MGWENQYIQLVDTKPGVIVAEEDREVSPETVAFILEKQAGHLRTYVELGSGSGMHLLMLAERNPDTLCVGFEIRFKRAFRTGEKAESRGLSNVILVRTDARNVKTLFEPATVDGFFVNYPDPWDKRRWRKNRLLSPELISDLHERLREGGLIRYKTDHHEYFESTMQLFAPERWEVTERTNDLMNSSYLPANIPTEFERLFRSQGKPLCYAEVRKVVPRT